MRWVEIIVLVFGSIWAHKLRSFLTLLGMIVGVAAVVIVVSIIQGFNSYVDEKIAKIGTKTFLIRRLSLGDFKNADSIAQAQKRKKPLTLDDMEYLRDHSTLIDKIGAKALSSSLQVRLGLETLDDVSVTGTTSNVAEIENTDIEDGRYFTDGENDQGSRVAFLGADVADKLSRNGSIVGQQISIGEIPYKVMGVAVAKGTIFGEPQDNYINIPIKSYAKDFGGALINQRGFYFVGTAKSDDEFEAAVEELRLVMRVRRRLQSTEADSFYILTPEAIVGVRKRIFGTIYVVALAVPSIALVVGGIVIMNIMLVSVTERTREIGLRKALGARRSDIHKQFLLEAVTLASIGGLLGIVVAWLAGGLISELYFPTSLSIISILIAIAVSATVGVLSGILPARKAAYLDPVEALRAE